jgi:hypothetical protein
MLLYFFERYVQWVFGQSVKRIGGEMVCNPKYAGHGANFDWLLRYLEPDIVLKFAETQIIVDAKYKSYLYRKHSKSDTLRESFRNDLHQLLAHTAFSTEKKKHCVLVAPFSRFERSKIQYRSPFSESKYLVLASLFLPARYLKLSISSVNGANH